MSADLTGAFPRGPLANFYFWYFVAAGAFAPFFGPFLQARGYSALQVGAATGMTAAVRIFSPYLWGSLVDRGHLRRMSMIRRALAIAVMCFCGLEFVQDFSGAIALLLLYSVFINGTLAQFEVVVFSNLAHRSEQYARIRLWASVGFVTGVLGIGFVFDDISVTTLPLWVAAAALACWWSARKVSEPEACALSPTESGPGVIDVLRRRPVQGLLAVSLLAQVSCGPYNSFFSIYAGNHGYAKSDIGFLWAIGVIAEVALLLVLPRLQVRFGLRRLMLLSLGTLCVRWILLPLCVDHLALLLLVQLTHAITVGMFYVVAVSLVQQMFPARLCGRGQAVFSGLTYGVGGTIGGFGSGMLWNRWQPEWIWIAASGIGALAWCVAWRWLHFHPAAESAPAIELQAASS